MLNLKADIVPMITPNHPDLACIKPENTCEYCMGKNCWSGHTYLGAKCNRWKNAYHICSGWGSNPGHLVRNQTLYHVALKVCSYSKAVQVLINYALPHMQWFIYNFGLMGPGTRCFQYLWVPTANLWVQNTIFNDKSAILLHPGTRRDSLK